MSIVGSDDGSPDNHLVDVNSTVQNSDIASIINSGVSSLHNDLDGLAKINSDMNGNIKAIGSSLKGVNSKLSDIGSKLDSIDASLNPATESDYSALDDGFVGVEDYINSVKDSFDLVQQNFDDTKALLNSGFKYTPPTSGCYDPVTTINNKQIKLSICEPLSKFRPFVYFILIISFTFLAIKIFIIGLAI
jgi:hypothetical protein